MSITYFDSALTTLGYIYFSKRRAEFMSELTKETFPELDIKSKLKEEYDPDRGLVVYETAYIDPKDSQAFKAFKVDDYEFNAQRIKDDADYVFRLRTDDGMRLYLVRVKRD